MHAWSQLHTIQTTAKQTVHVLCVFSVLSHYGTPSPPKIDFYYVNRSYCTRTDSPRSHRSDSAHVHRSAEIAKRFQYSVLRSPYRTAPQLPIPLASTERIRFDEIDRMCAYRLRAAICNTLRNVTLRHKYQLRLRMRINKRACVG